MKKLSVLFLALIMVLGCFVSCGNTNENENTEKQEEKISDYEQIKKKGVLVIGVTYYKPMSYFEDDEFTGFDTEYANAVCEKLGLVPQFTLINWDTKETLLKSGNIDCIWNGLTVSEERKENMAFTDSYLLNKQCIVINGDDEAKFTDTASFENAILTAEAGSAGETAIQSDANLSKATYSGSEDQQSALQAVKSGNADAAVVDITLANAVCGQGDFAKLKMLDIALTDEEYAIGFRLGSDMVEKVNAATKELMEDGTLSAIAEKYDMKDLFDAVAK